MIYWDTSCVLKLYCAESDSLAWQGLAAGAEEGLLSSALLSAELAFALARKEARGDIRRGGAKRLHAQFLRDVQAGRFQLIPVGADVLEGAAQLAARCLLARRPVSLRTLDGIHLATAVLMKCPALATADERMQSASAVLGLEWVAPRAGA